MTTSALPKFRMPGEWEPQHATWLAWPHFRGDWPGKFEPIPWVYAEIIRHLTRHERVELIVKDAAAEKSARRTLKLADALSRNIRFHRWPTNRVWMRDSGCTFVLAQQPGTDPPGPAGRQAIKWRFNAWAKYPNYKLDENIGTLMAAAAKCPEVRAMHGDRRVVLESGSIDSNGQGILLTTEECLLSRVQQRNPGFRREDYEAVFATCLGIEKVLWLGRGIEGDDTHGHVDDITRFIASDTIVTVVEHNPRDKNYAPLQENVRRLKAATDQHGKPFTIVELPMPSPVLFDGRRLPASYANFYIANGVVLVPVFNDPKDRIAMNILADLFPGREIVPIYSGDLIWGFGALHCMTQPQPALQDEV